MELNKMRIKSSAGFGLIVLLITMAIVAWLSVRSLNRNKQGYSDIQRELATQGITLSADEMLSPEKAAQAIKNKVTELQMEDAKRKEQAIGEP